MTKEGNNSGDFYSSILVVFLTSLHYLSWRNCVKIYCIASAYQLFTNTFSANRTRIFLLNK